MTQRQQHYKKNRIDGMSKKSAALKAGYSFTTATRQGKRLDRVVNMASWLEQEGLTDKCLAEHAAEGLKSKNPNIRHKYFETILKLRGKLTTAPIIDQSQHAHYTVTWEKNAKDSDRLSTSVLPNKDSQ